MSSWTRGRDNNNPYNQDNDINYLDWDLLRTNHDVFRFVQGMIAFRKAHPSIARSQFWREDVSWYGVRQGGRSFAGGTDAWRIACTARSLHDADIYVMVNAGANEVCFQIQEGKPEEWLLVADTSLPSPHDIADPGEKRFVTSSDYLVGGRSVVVLCRPNPTHNLERSREDARQPYE